MSAWQARWLPPIGGVVLLATLLLTLLGLLGLYAGEAAHATIPAKALKQCVHLAVGLAGFALIQVIGYRPFSRWAYTLFAITLILLALLLVAKTVSLAPLITPRRNAYRWIILGPVSLQVSEFAKIVYILAMAAYLRFRTNYRTLRGLAGPFILTLVPMGLILKEPDLGTSLVFLPTLFVLLLAAGARIRHLLLIILLGAAAVPAFYFSPIMSPYQRERIQSLFRQDENDRRWRMNAGYQLSQSKVAIGSGRLTGQGMREADFFRHDLLPEEHNDFIFAVVAHQWGLLGCLGVLTCYLLIIGGGLTIASMTTDPFGRLVAVGISGLIFIQTCINIGMTVGLMPITGLSLPFVSMGGSGLIANYLAIGFVVNVSRRRPPDVAPRPFEFADDDKTE